MVATATATTVFQTLARARALTGAPAEAAPTAVQMATTATVAPEAMEAMEVSLAIKVLQYHVAALLLSSSTAKAVACLCWILSQ